MLLSQSALLRGPLAHTYTAFVFSLLSATRLTFSAPAPWGLLSTGLIPSKDTLFIGDLEAARAVMASEMQLGVRGAWPDTMSEQHTHTQLLYCMLWTSLFPVCCNDATTQAKPATGHRAVMTCRCILFSHSSQPAPLSPHTHINSSLYVVKSLNLAYGMRVIHALISPCPATLHRTCLA